MIAAAAAAAAAYPASLTLKDWTEKFWEWIYTRRDEANPVTVVGPARPWRYAGGQPTPFQKDCMKKHKESVWFVAPAPYSEPGSVIQIYVPLGTWWLLVAPAIASAAPEMYPSLDTVEKLRAFVHKDTDKTYELWTIFDGFSVPWYLVDNTERLIEIEGIPFEKSKNFMRKDLSEGRITTVQYGYWNMIGPLSEPGDHLLTIHSRLPYYRVDVTYQIVTLGPEVS